ncbi:serum paraoxonase/lactonase 3 isoform X2 [Monodon monoceros]|uniref:serum paraoxonase/lactonase 3 isoform X2 n=1 Tax=Monodon monoceros TaxID=40151 RepID=UPI0010F71D52|nr:serum paraoxonase/lactonase 3 isoform X2 [Monodon monoceros]
MPSYVWSSVNVCGLNVNHVTQFKTLSTFHLGYLAFQREALSKKSREKPAFYSQYHLHRFGMMRKLCEGLNFNKLKCICCEDVENYHVLIKSVAFGTGPRILKKGLKYPGMPNFAPDEPGQIFLMDLNEQNPRVQALNISDGFDKASFNPHGISTFIDKDQIVYLYVVNHPHMESTVEIFKFEEQQRSLVHLKTIKHELLKSVNDIVVLGAEQFYATRDHYFTNFFLVLLEMVMDLRWTYILFYSPREVKVVAKGFISANGITISPDKKYIYVADVLDKNIHVMKKHDNWDLTQLKVIQLGTLVDNLTVDPDTGDILAGCHPNAIKLLMYNTEDSPGSEQGLNKCQPSAWNE